MLTQETPTGNWTDIDLLSQKFFRATIGHSVRKRNFCISGRWFYDLQFEIEQVVGKKGTMDTF